jgi:hypothetical protein
MTDNKRLVLSIRPGVEDWIWIGHRGAWMRISANRRIRLVFEAPEEFKIARERTLDGARGDHNAGQDNG